MVDDRDGVVPADAGPVTVLVVDDQAPFRAAAKAVVSRLEGFELVGEATSGEEAVERCAELHPRLVLMDINMDGINGIEATRQITAAADGTTMVVLVSTYRVDDVPPDARTSGAAAYVNKEDLSPRIIRQLWADGGDPDWR